MTEQTVRRVLTEHARLDADAQTIAVDADLHAAGMSSHASVNVMLGLEDELDSEFPDEMLNKQTFSSIASIIAAVDSLAG